MILPWWPVIVIDIVGSALVLALALNCFRVAWDWTRQNSDDVFRNYILLLTLAISVFAVSRSAGHLIKQLLLLTGQAEAWRLISPYSGAINSATFIVIFAFGIYFHRFQTVQTAMEEYQSNLEELIEERTAELRENNLELIKSRLTLDSVLNSSIPICITGNDFELILANQSYQELWPPVGEDRPKCFEQRPGTLCHTPLCPLEQIRAGKNDLVIEDTKVTAGGEQRSFLITSRPYADTDGRLLGMVESFQDITVWKKAAEERTLLERQLRQAQKMEALGTMAGGIAHDFNNILTAIIGFAEVGKIKSAAGADGSRFFDEILRAGTRAKDLVKHILAFSRRSEQSKEAVSVYHLTKEILRLIRASTPSTITIQEELDRDCGNIFADSTQIHQVLLNLCTNAVQVMEKGGGILKVALARRNITEHNASTASSVQPGLYAAISIGDTGPGIADDIREKIFDPYFTTKPVNEGTGLGLAVALGIIKNHGGVINFETRLGKGTTFQILLPLVQTEPPRKAASDIAAPGGNEHIMVVDDEPGIVEVLDDLLQSLGYQVTALTNSQEALEIFRSSPNKFDLVITDQTMPGLTGLELARKLTAIRPGLPVILSTGFSKNIDADTAKDYGIRAFAMKPVPFQEMAKLIRSVLT